jgi:hypothetical protein
MLAAAALMIARILLPFREHGYLEGRGGKPRLMEMLPPSLVVTGVADWIVLLNK